MIAGRGGDGRSSFSQTFQNQFGGPNGGDGGNGAHVILQGKTNRLFGRFLSNFRLASRNVTSLNNIRKMYIADNGEPGEANFKKGKSAEHLIIPVN